MSWIYCRIDLLNVFFILFTQDDLLHARPFGSQHLLFDASHRQDLAAQGDLPGHRNKRLDPFPWVKMEVRAVSMVIPAEGPSFGMAPSGTCR
jgi:hypothetical protein